MNYHIYFDESNKLDLTKQYSYYGAFGGNADDLSSLTKAVKPYYAHSNKELHFREYKDDKHVAKYYQVLQTIFEQDVNFNIFIVDNAQAFAITEEFKYTHQDLRKMFYIKIPERLFYGVTRNIEQNSNVRIFVDRSSEYRTIRLYSKLKEQMNAHAVYRNMKYRVIHASSQKSEESIPLQLVDLVMGIVVFLMEKTYGNDSVVTKVKSDLVYRFLSEKCNLEHFQTKIKIFQWDGIEQKPLQVHLAPYINQFFLHKQTFDMQEMLRVQELLLRNPDIVLKDLRKEMGYSNSLRNMLIGYLDYLSGKGRNAALHHVKNN
ncbi:TPA: DUF3800 domain-containing protein [Bacillus paranthracis]|uniref:DUF3800 domain-containing protein n=1 Tax=Bacillus cereus group TaxID=86661 RepID=UPI0022E7607A|nr:DUF3800 domain-containing protein [Bacillus cereus group sp. TH40LC]MDA1514559.1 DUF3800 domain-containing protein [Bacillus cereus group sp. TH40LC]